MSADARFRYWRDPWCVAGTLLYLLQRVVSAGAPALPAWWRGHATDVLLIPVGLPVWLWIERRVGWRRHDRMPSWQEALFVLTCWSLAAEVVAPWLFTSATADGWDVLAYAAGATVALAGWRST